MRDQCREIYERMNAEIGARQPLAPPSRKGIEDCFHVIFKANTAMQELANARLFRDKEEEIWFYKEIKPPLAAQMELFTLLYMAEVFAPDDGSERIKYWKHEQKKSVDFFSRHESFYKYYKSGSTEFDPDWFVRASSYPDLAALLIAHEQYLEYLKQKIEGYTN